MIKDNQIWKIYGTDYKAITKELLEQEKEREKEGDPNDDDFVDGAGDK